MQAHLAQFGMGRANGRNVALQRTHRTLGKDDNHAALAPHHAPLDPFGDLFDLPGLLGNHVKLRAAGKGGVQRNVAAIAAHHGNQAHPLVGIAGFANAVDGFAGGVDGGVEADGIIGIGQVVVDGTRHADCRNAQLVQIQRSFVGAVSADAHQALDAQSPQVVHRQLLIFFFHKFQTAGGHQERTPPLNLVGYAARG